MSQSGLPVQEIEYQRLAHAALARQELLAFKTYITPGYQTPPHIRMLAAYLEAVERGDIMRLLITAPPQHGKSELTSGTFPAWCIGKDPTRPIMEVCHTATLANTFSMQNRDLIKDNPAWLDVFPGVRLSTTKKGQDLWAVNKQRESFIASGVEGGITGFGAWLLLIDDPIKTYQQAISKTYKELMWMEYKTAARTRMRPDGRIVVIATRWVEDDLMGRLKEATGDGGEEWVHLHLPALSYGVPEDYREDGISEEEYLKRIEGIPKTAFPDPLGRHKDEPLWGDRYSKKFLFVSKAVMQHSFEAMYQGNPEAPEGNKLKRAWFRGITPELIGSLKLEPVARARSYDIAWSAKESADYTVGLKAQLYKVPARTVLEDAKVPKDLMQVYDTLPPVLLVLEDEVRWQKEFDDWGEDLIITAIDDTNKYEILIEAVASQNKAFKSLRRDMRLWNHVIIPVQKTIDKEIAAKVPMKLGALGCLFILYPSITTPPDWEKGFLQEVGAFPAGKNDDRVDALSQLTAHWITRIDTYVREALTKNPVSQWKTPFMTEPSVAKRKNKLPPEFVEDSPFATTDRLGMV